MPNHVYNKLTGTKEVLSKYLTNGELDFRKIKKIPKTALDPVARREMINCIQNLKPTQKKKIIQELETNNFFVTETEILKFKKGERVSLLNFLKYNKESQYSWQVNNWGTKWNAYDQSILEEGENITIEFSTAWSPVCDLMQLLSKKTKTKLRYEFIEEQGAECIGWQIFQNGVKIDCYEPKSWSKGAYELMFAWWGNSSEYRWDEKEKKYKYIEEE